MDRAITKLIAVSEHDNMPRLIILAFGGLLSEKDSMSQHKWDLHSKYETDGHSYWTR